MRDSLISTVRAAMPIKWSDFLVLLYFVLVAVAAVQSASLFWNVYTLINPATFSLSDNEQLPPDANVYWGSWIDQATSQPLQKTLPKKTEPQKNERNINVQIQLVGVFNTDGAGVAIMSVNGSTQRVYKRGDVVVDDVLLQEVKLYSVVVGTGGLTKEYFLPEAQSVIGAVSGQQQIPASASPSSVQTTLPKVPVVNNSPPTIQPVRKLSPQVKNQVDDVKKQIKEKPLTVATLGNFKPVNVNGNIGIQVRSFKYRDVMLGLGLQLNDIVLAVNGISIRELSSNTQRAYALLEERNLKVSVLRNGRNIIVPVQW